ncbi:MAG: universal stress protein [Deltaproteobacteria bacterium]|nr:universal stress protein [Deltaproteobacteria bacterium]
MMAWYQNILVAVDGSEESLHALREAFKLADARSFLAVSVAPPYEGDLRSVGVNDIKTLIRQPCDTALAAAQKIADEAGVPLKTACVFDEPHAGIVNVAESENCDLIVIGAKGRGLLERLLVGSVARRVIGFTKRDVLVVPFKGSLALNKIMLATDGSENSQPAGNRALELAQAYGAELKVLSVLELPSPIGGNVREVLADLEKSRKNVLTDIRAQAEALGLTTECFTSQGPPARTIVAEAQKQGVNLIVMGSHGRTGLSRLLMGSVTERVIGLSPCPVLVVKV